MKRGFTLIELLAVIVILAIIALITIPAVLKMTDNAKVDSYRRSIDLYGKAVNQAITTYENDMIEKGEKIDLNLLTINNYIDYEGNDVECDISLYSDKTIFMTNCNVDDNKVYAEEGKGYGEENYYYYTNAKKKINSIMYIEALENQLKDKDVNGTYQIQEDGSIKIGAEILKVKSNLTNPIKGSVTIKNSKVISYENLEYNTNRKDTESNLNEKIDEQLVSSNTNNNTNINANNNNKVDNSKIQLSNGLIPVAYKNGKWVVVSNANSNNEWYNYDEQKWANAVTLLPGIKKDIGDEIKVDGTEASMMFVWIPRYEYKYTDMVNVPREISINFISKDVKIPSSSEYKIHPAFTFGDTELSGIWVGKFEISHTKTSSELKCNGYYCQNDMSYLRILPNISSLRWNDVSNFFYGIREIEEKESFGLKNVDSHMIKNSEWGAIAYLSQSKYGKYGNSEYSGADREIYRSKSYTTGTSSGPYSKNNNTNMDCKYDDMEDNCGPGASTTGNIYGVYGMNGGAWEYVMGVYALGNSIVSGYNSYYNSGFDGYFHNNWSSGNLSGATYNNSGAPIPNSKYYDVYNSDDEKQACNGSICYGHALSETNGWYRDKHDMVSRPHSWMTRGGGFNEDTYSHDPNETGIFYYGTNNGHACNGWSTRAILVELNK